MAESQPKTQLSHEEVRAIADLARLEISEEEVALYAEQISAILAYFTRLQEVDTSEVDAIASVLPLSNVMRPDVPRTPLDPEQVIANAPQSQDDQFKVAPVLGDGSA